MYRGKDIFGNSLFRFLFENSKLLHGTKKNIRQRRSNLRRKEKRII